MTRFVPVKKGTGHPLKANALIWLMGDSKSWRSVRQVEML
jgi:hypothetical protein